jgi:hypothetical protein
LPWRESPPGGQNNAIVRERHPAQPLTLFWAVSTPPGWPKGLDLRDNIALAGEGRSARVAAGCHPDEGRLHEFREDYQ